MYHIYAAISSLYPDGHFGLVPYRTPQASLTFLQLFLKAGRKAAIPRRRFKIEGKRFRQGQADVVIFVIQPNVSSDLGEIDLQ